MKKLIVPTILVLLFCAFGACNSDDDQTAPQTVEDPMEEDPVEEDPVDEDPVDEVVERTDRLLEYTWWIPEGGLKYSFEYEDGKIQRYGYGANGGRSIRIESMDGDRISTARIQHAYSGGYWFVNVTISYNQDWIQDIHLAYADDLGQTWDNYYEFEQNGNETLISQVDSWREWTITFTEDKRWLEATFNAQNGFSANYTYQDNNLVEANYNDGNQQTYEYDIRHNPFYLYDNTNFYYVEPILQLIETGGVFGYNPYTGIFQNHNNVTNYTTTTNPDLNRNYEYTYDDLDFPVSRTSPSTGDSVYNYWYQE